MAVIPYLSQGQGVEIDPLTGLPRKKKASAFTQGQVSQSLALNPQGTFGPSPSVNYAGGPTATGAARPSNQPDYRALIEQALGPLRAQFDAEGIADASGRDQQFIRTLGQFGQQFDLGQANQAFGPDFVNSAGLGGILPKANELAAQTTGAGMSFTARASKAHKDAVRQIRNSLAARGLLRSGEAGHQLQEAQTAFDTGQYDARQQLQDYLAAINKGYTEAKRAREAQLAQAALAEAPRQAALNPMTGVPEGGIGPGLPPAPVAPRTGYDQAVRTDLPPGWIGAPAPATSINAPNLSQQQIAEFLQPLGPPRKAPYLAGGGITNRYG